jgi:hypothetical protein
MWMSQVKALGGGPMKVCKLMVIVLQILLVENTYAIDSHKSTEDHFSYQQSEISYSDPEGDYSLLEIASYSPLRGLYNTLHLNTKLEKFIEKVGVRHSMDPEYTEVNIDDALYEMSQDSSYSKKYQAFVRDQFQKNISQYNRYARPFHIQKTLEMFKQVMLEEYDKSGVTPFVGKIHKWSDGLEKNLKLKHAPFLATSKVLLALSHGITYQFMYTGSEEALEEFIYAQAPLSMTLDKLFRKSYQLAGGDLYLALLTIENVLSRFWPIEDRDNLLLTSKFGPLTPTIDKFGAWYHLFGTLLYGLVRPQVLSVSVSVLEGVGSSFLSLKVEMQEMWVNIQGARIGHKLAKFAEKDRIENVESNPGSLAPEHYLKHLY